jgi:hypothetical protein
MLASAGVDVNQQNDKGETPLHIAARNGLVGVLANLLLAGGDPNIRNKLGETPLHLVGGPLPHITAQVLLLHGAEWRRWLRMAPGRLSAQKHWAICFDKHVGAIDAKIRKLMQFFYFCS